MKLHHIAVAAVLANALMPAMSLTVDIGTLPTFPQSYSTSYITQGDFADRFNFVAPSTASTASGAASGAFFDGYAVSDVNLSLYASDNFLVSKGIGIDTGGMVTLSYLADVPLTAGADYYFLVTGRSTGTDGAWMSLFASSAPVPEPQAFALMLAGLAAVGCAIRWRRGDPTSVQVNRQAHGASDRG